MNRAEARVRLLRRAGAALLLMLGLAGVAFTVGRLVRAHTASGVSPAPSGATAVVLAPRPTDLPPPPVASESPAPTPTASRRMILPMVPHDTPPKITERTITLHLQPTMGLTLSIDEEPPRDVSTGETLRLDTKAHGLTFACEVCTPEQRTIAGGDKDDTLNVTVPVKAAILDLRGDPDKNYQIVEDPQLAIRAGSNNVAMKSRMFWAIHVREMETDRRIPVRLAAGKTVSTTF
jgi:hypothetical protein